MKEALSYTRTHILLHQNILYSFTKSFPEYTHDVNMPSQDVIIVPRTEYSRKHAPSQSFQQEENESNETEKHKQVYAEERPATAIQPVSQGTLPPQRATPEGSSQSLFVHVQKSPQF